jgi:hypothetical protein
MLANVQRPKKTTAMMTTRSTAVRMREPLGSLIVLLPTSFLSK